MTLMRQELYLDKWAKTNFSTRYQNCDDSESLYDHIRFSATSCSILLKLFLLHICYIIISEVKLYKSGEDGVNHPDNYFEHGISSQIP